MRPRRVHQRGRHPRHHLQTQVHARRRRPRRNLVVGEEFEIATRVPGQVWTVTFADNGSTFFTADDVAPPTGIREVHPNPDHGGSHHMSAHALNHTTGETIDAAVDVPPAPPRCGH